MRRGCSRSCAWNGSLGPGDEYFSKACPGVYPVETRGEWQCKQGDKLMKLHFLGKLFWPWFGVVDAVLETVNKTENWIKNC